MSLIGLILTLVVVGVLLWLLNNYVPMDSKIKTIINVVVVIVVVVWLYRSPNHPMRRCTRPRARQSRPSIIAERDRLERTAR
jgi:multisubunit Na+/H+ antiporter MnhE subunit